MNILGDKIQGVKFFPSPNIGGKIKDHKYIIIHFTASSTASGAIEWMLNPSAKVSAHLHLGRDGEIVQLVPFNIVAWHAGQSSWKGVTGINSYSVGIECQNTGTQEYPQAQLDQLVLICKALVSKYGFIEILGHSDIAPGRKTDPGKKFPMSWLRDQVYGKATPVIVTKHTTSDLNLRDGAGTNFKALSVLPKGTEVNVLSESNEWSHVFVCGSKLIGHVSSKYLK